MQTTESAAPRVLLIGRDNFFAESSNITADFVPTGPELAPYASPDGERKNTSLFTALIRYMRNSYDCIYLPSIDFAWPHDGPVKRTLRLLLRTILISPVSTIVRRILKRRKNIVCVLDASDKPTSDVTFVEAVRPNFYFKRNLSEVSGKETLQGDVRFLPLDLRLANYPEPNYKKSVDIFFAGDLGLSEERHAVSEVAEALEKAGVSFHSPESWLPFDDYVKQLSSAYLSLSPAGTGWYCYRHYETMLAGSVPVISLPEIPHYTDLKEGETCLFYNHRNIPELIDKLQTALQDRERLIEWGRALRAYAAKWHSRQAVANYLLTSTDLIEAADPYPEITTTPTIPNPTP